MASQEFLASFAVEIDEAGVSRLQTVLSENRDLANEVAAAFEAATAAINEYQKAALGGDNPSGEGNRDDGSGKGGGSAEGSRDTGSPYNPEASARNLENGEYRSGGYKGEIQGLLSGSLTSSPDSTSATRSAGPEFLPCSRCSGTPRFSGCGRTLPGCTGFRYPGSLPLILRPSRCRRPGSLPRRDCPRPGPPSGIR